MRWRNMKRLCTNCRTTGTEALGLCQNCYQYERRHGTLRPTEFQDTVVLRKEMNANAWCKTRFDRLFEKQSNGCWFWISAKAGGNNKFYGKGYRAYGYFTLHPKKAPVYAHRAAWLLYRGEIPKGACVVHLCSNALCVNPEHLTLGTNKTAFELSRKRGTYHWDRKKREAREIVMNTVKFRRVIRQIEYYGPKEWVDSVLGRSLLDGPVCTIESPRRLEVETVLDETFEVANGERYETNKVYL